jgi:hypothetical protein
MCVDNNKAPGPAPPKPGKGGNATITLTLADLDLGFTGPTRVRDVWSKRDLGVVTDGTFTTNVS